MKYANLFTEPTHVSEKPLDRPEMVRNNAGGYTFKISPEEYLRRFLILGTEGGTYYQSEKAVTVQAAQNVVSQANSPRTVEVIEEIACARPARAPKMEPSLFALAVCTAMGSPEVKARALEAMPRICRIPTHLFTWLDAHKKLGGKTGGRAMKRALQDWYQSKPNDKLAYHLAKYQSRGGWSNRDVLRLARPTPTDPTQEALFGWAVKGEYPCDVDGLDYIKAVDLALKSTISERDLIKLIREFGLTHEMIANDHKKSPKIWEALLESMPLGAMIRNLNRFSSLGMTGPFSDVTTKIIGALSSEEALIKARIHPLNLYVAQRTYQEGRGIRGSLTWTPEQRIVTALEEAFYASFGLVEPTNKRVMIGLDVSGSMTSTYGAALMGIPGFSPMEAETVMSMFYVRTEPNTVVFGFDDKLRRINIDKNTSFKEAYREVRGNGRFGSTNPSLLFSSAQKMKIPVDLFMVFTDNECNTGVHSFQALKSYRAAMKVNSALVVNAMTATPYSIAEPQDPKMLDVIGFDTNVPQVIKEICG